MTIREMHQSNRAAWNEAAAHYREDLKYRIAFLRAGGTDTLSLWNLGAQEVVGVDISEDMVAVARAKSEALNASARWLCCDILDAPHHLDGTADLVYTGRGAINWLHDMDGWAGVVARLLTPGGRLYVFEGHPLTWVWDTEASELRLDPVYGDYFQTTAQANQGRGPTYIGELAKAKEELSRKYESQKTFAQIINPLLQVGLRLEKLEEHAEPFWNHLPNLPPKVLTKLPNTFSLLMRKD